MRLPLVEQTMAAPQKLDGRRTGNQPSEYDQNWRPEGHGPLGRQIFVAGAGCPSLHHRFLNLIFVVNGDIGLRSLKSNDPNRKGTGVRE